MPVGGEAGYHKSDTTLEGLQVYSMKLRTKLIGAIAVIGLGTGYVLLPVDLSAAVYDTYKEPPAAQPSSQPDYSQIFTDIGNCYAQTEIVDLHNRGIINGVGDKTFAPNKSISRAEFITMLDRTLGISPLDSHVAAFRDVPRKSWAFGWIQAGVELGIANGTEIAAFSPNNSITREEAATLLVRALKIKTNQNDPQTRASYADASSISGRAASYVMLADQAQLMHGFDGNFRPREAITRQETAVVLYRILQNDKWRLTQPKSTAPKINLGWQYGIPTSEFEQRSTYSGLLNTVSPRWFFLEPAGTFSDQADPSLLPWANTNVKKVWPLVGNRFNREATHLLLSQPQTRQAAVAQLTECVKKYQLAGLNIDFENLDPHDRDAFSTFVAELAASLHAIQAQLTVNVPMNVGTDWSDPYDYTALGRLADYIVIMAYDEHWIGSSVAGSVSSLHWMEQGVDKILASVSPQKTIVGLPLYTRDWYSKNGTVVSDDITLSQQDNLLGRNGAQYTWDASAGQYVARYSVDEVQHTIWLEDSRSLAAKYQMLERKAVAGYAFWYIGAETDDIWKSMQNVIKYEEVGE